MLSNENSIYFTNEIKRIEILGYSTLIIAVDKDKKFKKGYKNLTKFVAEFK